MTKANPYGLNNYSVKNDKKPWESLAWKTDYEIQG